MKHQKKEPTSFIKILTKVIRCLGLILYWALTIFILFLGIVGRPLSDWYKATFNTNFREIIYTFGLGLKGADASFMLETVHKCRYELATFCCVIAIIFIYEVVLAISARNRHTAEKIISRTLILAIAVTLFVPTYRYADKVLKVTKFLKARFTNTTLYEDYYISPNDVSITTNNKRNVILIYMESLETTYAAKELGGYQETNLIPNLTEMAENNISFGDRGAGKLSGTHNPYGTTWTTAAILASESGVPFAFRVGKNQAGKQETFGAHLTTLGDFLQSEGYKQAFVCGSDSEFGGKKAYFQQHGDFDIYDYNTAIEDGYIGKDYKVWWGMEDHRMYEMARDKLTELASSGEPFNFTMLTVDTHHVGGYICDWCPDTYPDRPTATVVACADQQIKYFIDWCSEQDFYDDTTIVIMGDHPRMDKKLVHGVDRYEREAYNCIINASVRNEIEEKRLATTMDLFPTILASMGYEIEGDRLGLGTNLFSNRETLAEELTYDKLNDELGKNSNYYIKNFS